MQKIVLWGSSKFAKYTADIVEQEGRYTIVGFFDPTRDDGDLYGYPVFGQRHGFAELLKRLNVTRGLVAIGDNWVRKRESDNIRTNVPSFEFVNAIHPSTLTGRGAKLGTGIVVMAGVAINNDTVVGDGSFLATHCSLDHDSTMGQYSTLSAGSTIGGSVRIGDYSFIALGARIISDVHIGSHTVVGAGSLVLKDLPSHVTAFGSPARIVSSRAEGDPYLHPRGTRSNVRRNPS